MIRGSPVLSGSTINSTSSINFPSNHRPLKRSRKTTPFKPPTQRTSTLPRFLSSCPSSLTSFIVKFINIIVVRPKQNQLIHDELWVKYEKSEHHSHSESSSSSSSGSWVKGTIINPEERFWDSVRSQKGEVYQPDVVVDGGGSLVSAGFIDIQLNGAFGIDFTSNNITQEQVHTVSAGILAHGVTSYLPTVITSPHSIYEHAIPTIASAGRDRMKSKGANIIGLHLEGPFIHPMKKGAHPIEHILSPTEGMKTVRDAYGHLEMVRIVTLAPELPGSFSAISGLTTMGVAVAVGHTTTSLSTAVSSVNHGTRLVTHLFNAMSAFHHRDPGLVGILTSKVSHKIHYGIIVDGIHVHPTAVKMAYQSHPKGAILVTDAMCALGLPPGRHMLGALEVDVIVQGESMNSSKSKLKSSSSSSSSSQGSSSSNDPIVTELKQGQQLKAVLASNHDTLAGSVASMDECVRNYISFTGCSIIEALEAASLHPALTLGIEQQKGSLDPGKDADLVFLNPKTLQVRATFVSGVCCYTSTNEWKEKLRIF